MTNHLILFDNIYFVFFCIEKDVRSMNIACVNILLFLSEKNIQLTEHLFITSEEEEEECKIDRNRTLMIIKLNQLVKNMKQSS